MISILVLVFTGSLLLSFLIHRFLLINSRKYNLKKANISGIRWDSQSKPILGGITFYTLFVTTFLVSLFVLHHKPVSSNQGIALFLVVTLSFFMGFADDLLNAPPSFKFMVQAVNAVILIYFGLYIQITNYAWINYALTVLWMAGIMNSINMIDNMDAISSTISITILSGMLINMLLSSGNDPLFFILITLGALASLISFLYFNWNPSKMYIGDNGSQFLGSLLGILAILFIWNYKVSPSYQTTFKQILILIITFLVPITDTASVTINRLLKGKSPFIGGRDHTTHHLYYMGLKESQVALTLMTLSAISVGFGIFLSNFVPVWKTFHTLISVIYISVVFGSLYSVTRITKPKQP